MEAPLQHQVSEIRHLPLSMSRPRLMEAPLQQNLFHRGTGCVRRCSGTYWLTATVTMVDAHSKVELDDGTVVTLADNRYPPIVSET